MSESSERKAAWERELREEARGRLLKALGFERELREEAEREPEDRGSKRIFGLSFRAELRFPLASSFLSPLASSLSYRYRYRYRFLPQFLFCIEAGACFLWVEGMVGNDYRFSMPLLQEAHEVLKSRFLLFGASILRLPIFVETSNIADSDAMAVVTLAVSTNLFFVSTLFYCSVEPHHIMVANALPAPITMPAVYVFRSDVLAFDRRTAMND